MTELRENQDVRRSFLTTPDPRVYFPGSTIEKARQAVVRCLKRGEGVATVVGAPGMGKTLLARTIAAELGTDSLVAVTSVTRHVSVKAFLQQFMFGLHRAFNGADETELRLMALDYLEKAPQKRCMLLIDDAHNLTLRVFDEIRRLIDQSAAVQKQLSVALFGANALEDRLAVPALFPFQQRVVSHSYLDVFKIDEVGKYIDAELKRAGVPAEFSLEAKREVAKLSSGVPRVVTQLCDRVLFLAFDGEIEFLDPMRSSKATISTLTIGMKEIERGWKHLQSIPDEQEEQIVVAHDAGPVVSYGLLDEDDDEEYNNTQVEAQTSEPLDAVEESATQVESAQEVSVVEVSTELSDEETEPQAEPVAEEAQETETQETDAQEVASEDEANEALSPFALGMALAQERIDLTHEARRLAAKREFWGEDDSTVFVAGLGGSEVEDVEEVGAEADEEIEELEEEEEGAAVGYEIDAALDARLREKYGFGIDALHNVEEDPNYKDEEEEVEGPYEFVQNGMRFEVSDRSELDSATAASVGLDVLLSAQNESEEPLPAPAVDRPDAESKPAYDAQFDMSANHSPRYERNEKTATRRPIEGFDDGSHNYRSVNGFKPEDAALIAASSPIDPQYVQEDAPGESAPTFSDQAYEQIVALETAPDPTDPAAKLAKDPYLTELELLEKEIAEEENLLRRIHTIHTQLRSKLAAEAQRGDAE